MMKIARALQSRPWAFASAPKIRPFGSLQLKAEPEKLDDFYKSFHPTREAAQNSEIEYVYCPTEAAAREILLKIREEALSGRAMDFNDNFSVVTLNSLNNNVNNNNNKEPAPGMGSFTSTPAVASGDCQDDDLHFPETSEDDLLSRCREELAHLPQPLNRKFRKYSFQHTQPRNTDDDDTENIRILQWNHLSQTLGTKNDKFVRCPTEALSWSTRRWRLIEEILRYQPDVICLQEVDHFNLLKKALGSVGYSGQFVPKPDSPCIYLAENNGPDGCAIFVKESKFDILSEAKRVLEVWKVQSNQVVLCLNLRHKKTGKEISVATTHLKARQGALLSTLRNEQGKDMLDWLAAEAAGRPLLLSGDFNAEQSEPVYHSVTNHQELSLRSAYNFERLESDEYTTWKIRETGEQKYVLDYIFHSETLRPTSVLEMPTEEEVGENRLPSLRFPSDHLTLVADFALDP